MKKWAIIIIVGFVSIIVLSGYKTFLSLTHPTKYQDIIISTCKNYNLPPALVASVINVESSYKNDVVSNKNAIGLMQIKKSTANYVGQIYNLPTDVDEQQLIQPKTNIEYGCAYLHYLYKKFNDWQIVIASYNAGETIVRCWLKDKRYSLDGKNLINIPYKETENYMIKVQKNIKFYQKIY